MPDVGVLELQIHDNSQQAGGGLDALARALSAVKDAKKNFDLSKVGQQVTQLTKTIQETKGASTIIKNLGTMFNSINKFASMKEFTIDAGRLKETALYLNKVADAQERVRETASQAAGDWRSAMGGEGRGKSRLSLKENIQLFGGNAKDIGPAFTMSELTKEITSANHNVAKQAEDAGKQLGQYFSEGFAKETENGLKITVPGYVNFSSELRAKLAHMAFEASKEKGPGWSYGIGSGQYPDENGNIISTLSYNLIPPIEKASESIENAKENADSLGQSIQSAETVAESLSKDANDISNLFVNVESQVQKVGDEISEKIETGMSNATTYTEEYAMKLAESIEKARQFHQILQKKYEVKPQTFEDMFYGIRNGKQNTNDLMSRWLNGDGSKKEQDYAIKYAARQFNMTIDEVISKIQELKNASSGGASSVQNIANAMNSVLRPGGPLVERTLINGYYGNSIQNAPLRPGGPLVEKTLMNGNAPLRPGGPLVEKTLVGDIDATSQAFTQVSSTIQDTQRPTQDLADDLKNLDKEIKQKKTDCDETKNAFERLKDGMQAMFPTLSGLLKRFVGMAKMRALRYVIREIAKGFSEGVQNVYQYSKAVGTNLAPSMDSAATAMLQLKNSIGAAVAPLVQSLVPVLQTVVNWVITGINYLNQFFALLRGQNTWTKAVEYQTTAYDDNTKKAKNAAKAAKDLLADWDELNIIQSNSDGSGSGTSGKKNEDYSKMFEEVSEYADWIKNIVDGIEDQFGSIWNLAKKVGLAILAWKVSSAFGGIIGTLAGLIGAAFTLGLVFEVTTVFDKKWLETGKVGWLIASVLTPLIGGFFTEKILGTVLGGSLAKLAIPLSLGISAIADVVANVNSVDTSAISKESLGLSAASALKVGGAAAYLAKTVMGHALGPSLAGGAAIAIATFGVAVGIKTVARATAGADTEETIKGLALSSLSMGIGAGLFAKLAGATVLGAFSFGAAAAGLTLLTLTAAIGIAALLTLSEKQKVKWGDRVATEKEIKAFVENEVFTASPSTILNITDPVIKVNEENKENLKATVDEVTLTVKKITIGFNEKDTLDDLKKQIFGDEESGTTGLIGQFKETAKSQQNVIETGLTISPATGMENDGSVKSIIDESSEGWKLLTGHMNELGKQLSTHMAEAYKADISEESRQMEIRTIQELTGMMTRVSSAITKGEAEEKAIRELTNNLSGLSQDSWDKMFEYVEEYKKSVTSAYETAYDAVTDAMAGEVAGLKVSMDNALALSGGDENNADYRAYKEEYDRLKEILDARRDARKDALDEYAKSIMNDDVVKRIRTALASVVDRNALDPTKVMTIGLQEIGGADYMSSLWQILFDPNGIDKGDAKNTVEDWLYKLMVQGFGEGNASTLKSAIDAGLLGYGDIINQEVIDNLAKTIGINTASAEVQSAWKNLITTLLGDKIEVPPVNDYTFKQSLESLKKKVEDIVYKIKLDLASLDGINVSLSVSMVTGSMMGALGALIPKRATGGFVRSGDLVMANENGNFELMGKMGNQPVVANNQQIIAGISNGVSQANGGVESRLSTIETLLQKLLQKELVAKAVPSSGWGRNNAQSADAYNRVTG